MKTIRKGDKGEEVKTLQRALGLTVDGIFGPMTDTAVRQFQRMHDLVDDGIVGAMTWAALTGANSATVSSKCVDPSVVYMPLSVHVSKLPGRTIKYLAIHFTAGSSSAAGRARSIKHVFEQRQASADFAVDDAEMVQFNPDLRNYYCWAVGDKKAAKVNCPLARTRNTYSTAAKPYVFVRSTAASSSYLPNTVAFVVSTVAISLDEHNTDNIIKAVTDGMVLYNINGYWHLVVKRSDSKVLDHQFATRLASGFNWAVLLDYRASKLTFKATNTAGSALFEESVDLSSLDIDFGEVYYLAGLGTNGIVPDVIFSYNDLYVTIDSYSDPLTCGNYKIAGNSGVSDTTGANLTDGLNTTAMDAIYTTHSYDSVTGAYTGSLNSDSYTANSVLQVKDAIAKFDSDDTVWRVTLKVTGSMTIRAHYSYIRNWIIKDLTAGTEEMVSSVAADHVLTDGHEYEFIYKAGWYSGNWFFAKGDFTAVWSGLQWLSILHTDLTPSNYDGKMIKGNIDFYYDNPSKITTVPQVIVGTSNPWNVVGTQRVDTSGNIYYKVKSGNSLIEKKINNT